MLNLADLTALLTILSATMGLFAAARAAGAGTTTTLLFTFGGFWAGIVLAKQLDRVARRILGHCERLPGALCLAAGTIISWLSILLAALATAALTTLVLRFVL